MMPHYASTASGNQNSISLLHVRRKRGPSWILILVGMLVLLLSVQSFYNATGVLPPISYNALLLQTPPDEHNWSSRRTATGKCPKQKEEEEESPLLSTLNENNPSIITVVVAHCHEDLNYLDSFGCENFQFVIMSKCADGAINTAGARNARIPAFRQISNCVTVHRIENCGVEEYAYFTFIENHYDHPFISNASMIAFIQSGAMTENPHILHDLLHVIPGTYYADLTRYVTWAWPTEREDPVKSSMLQLVAPVLLDKKRDIRTWIAGWRGQFMVSRDAIQRIPQQVYHDLNQKLCSNKCKENNCGAEMWMSTMFGCSDIFFQDYDNNNNKGGASSSSTTTTTSQHCQSYEYDLSAMVMFPEDFNKDSMFDVLDHEALVATSTKQTTCGTKTMLLSKSMVNGRLICIEHDQQEQEQLPMVNNNNTKTSVVANHNNNNRIHYKWWRNALYHLYRERQLPVLPKNLNWRFQRKMKKVLVLKPSWFKWVTEKIKQKQNH